MSNYPNLTWSSSNGWSPTSLRISPSVEVDDAGLLLDPLHVFDVSNEYVLDEFDPWRTEGEPWTNMNYWSEVFPGRPLFPGEYFWQVVGSPSADGFIDRETRDWSPPRRLVVTKFVGKPNLETGEEIYGSSSVAIPVTASMTTNLESVKLAFAMKINGRSVCRANRPMLFVYGSDQTVSRQVLCRIPFSLVRAEGTNDCVVTVAFGSRADIGRVIRVVSRTKC